MPHKLLKEEKAIENEIDNLVLVSDENKKKIERILAASKKNRSISLRISNFHLERLKEKAQEQGIPYQTLINSILHKYITEQFVERKEIVKFFQLVKSEKHTMK
ncbi:MAG: antitoxin [Calditrichaeota bacterium]|nr:antitoxin [Calditrichota bacterium]